MDPSYDPCTCDLTVDFCDQNCCCDPDCTPADLIALNLVCPIKYRSLFEETIDKWTCKDMYNNPKFEEPDYFPILCIQVESILRFFFCVSEQFAFVIIKEATIKQEQSNYEVKKSDY